MLPETAVRYDANGASVMVVGADGKVAQVPVRTGDRGDGYVELLSGPPAGSVVVAKAGAQLLAGDCRQAGLVGVGAMTILHPGPGGGGPGQLRISAWAIRNPTPVAVLFIALVLAAIVSYFTLPVKNFPNIEFPLVIVTVTQSARRRSS